MHSKMSICHICLRTDRKVQTLDKKLVDFLDDLCDFATIELAQYCLECAHTLKKFYEFREKCILAVKVLKKWKKLKPAEKTPLDLLYTQLPPPRLSLCNIQNCKVYFYQETELVTAPPTKVLPKIPCMVIDPSKLVPTTYKSENETDVTFIYENNNKTKSEHYTKNEGINNNERGHVKSEENGSEIIEIEHLNDDVSSDMTNEDGDDSLQEEYLEIDLSNDAEYLYVDLQNDAEYLDNDLQNKVEYLDNDLQNETEYLDNDLRNNAKYLDNDQQNDAEYLDNDPQNYAECLDNDLQNDAEYLDNDQQNDAEYLDNDLHDDVEYLDIDLLNEESEYNIESNVNGVIDENKTNKTLIDFSKIDKKDIIHADIDVNSDKKMMRGVKRSEAELTDHDYVEPKMQKRLSDIGNKRRKYDEKRLRKHKEVSIPKTLSPNLEMLKNMLEFRFEKAGEVKDEDGIVIDKELILNCLNKLPQQKLRQITDSISESTLLKPEAIKLFSKLQTRYSSEFETIFTTEYISKTEHVLAEFNKRQHHESYTTANHKCVLCYRGFKFKKSLDYHLKVKHDESAPLFCTLCQLRFRDKRIHAKHKLGHRKLFKCKLCPLITAYRSIMVKHYYVHKGVILNCKTCPRTFKSESELSSHSPNCVGSGPICRLCARTFMSPNGLRQHTTLKHKNEMADVADSIKCDTCQVTFSSLSVYLTHAHKAHGEITRRRTRASQKTHQTASIDVRVPERTDDKSWSLSRTRRRAKRKTETEHGYVCRLCSSSGPSVGWLNQHFNREHPEASIEEAYRTGRKHLCHICGSSFSNKTSLTAHKHLHTGAKPYVCSECGARFRRSFSLSQHCQRHLPPTWECDLCGKKFHSRSNLINHKRIHNGERRYKCPLCPASFIFHDGLKAHTRGVHQHVRRVRAQRGPKVTLCAQTQL